MVPEAGEEEGGTDGRLPLASLCFACVCSLLGVRNERLAPHHPFAIHRVSCSTLRTRLQARPAAGVAALRGQAMPAWEPAHSFFCFWLPRKTSDSASRGSNAHRPCPCRVPANPWTARRSHGRKMVCSLN